MRGDADDCAVPEQFAGGGRSEIVLSNMNAGSSGQARNVDTVIDDDVCFVGSCEGGRRGAEIEEGTGRKLLGAELNQCRTAVEKRACEIERRPAGPFGRLDI